MTTSPPNAWAWLDGRDVPVSIDSLNLSVSDTLREQNDNPDPTYQDCWPSERYPSDGDQCPECKGEGISWYDIGNDMDSHEECRTCHGAGVRFGRETPRKLRVGARNEHPACDVSKMGNFPVTGNITVTAPETTAPADSCVASCGSCADTVCADILPEGELRNAAPPCAYYRESPTFPQGENSADVKVDSCPECGAVTDIEYGEVDQTLDTLDPTLDQSPDKCTFHVPFRVQEFMFEELCNPAMETLHDMINDHAELIGEMARDRFRKGYAKYGSAAYQWDAETRMTNVLEELADAVVYLTTGGVESSAVTDKCRGSETDVGA